METSCDNRLLETTCAASAYFVKSGFSMGSMPIARPNMTMARSRAMGALGVTVPSPLPLRIPAAAQRLMAAKNQSWVLLSAKPAFSAAGS